MYENIYFSETLILNVKNVNFILRGKTPFLWAPGVFVVCDGWVDGICMIVVVKNVKL